MVGMVKSIRDVRVFDGKSSFIDGIKPHEEGIIVTMDGKDYLYRGCRNLYPQFVLALSLGEFFNGNIRGKFPVEKL